MPVSVRYPARIGAASSIGSRSIPRPRRRGLGRRLQHAAEELARELDAVYLVAETSTLPAYAAARGFYLSGGFTLLAEVPDWHDDGDGMAIFRKRL